MTKKMRPRRPENHHVARELKAVGERTSISVILYPRPKKALTVAKSNSKKIKVN